MRMITIYLEKKSAVESSGGPKSGVAAFSARRADILIKEAQVQEFFLN